MLERIRSDWTIVILGTWNIGIFNPAWLTTHVFESKEVSIEFGIEPGLPRKIIGDKIIILPMRNKLIIATAELNSSTIQKMEDVACKILDLLEHTPVTHVGINFVYKVHPVVPEIMNQFPDFQRDKFSDQHLILKSRHYGWDLDQEGQKIKLVCDLDEEGLLIKFNFHAVTPNTTSAKEHISGNVLNFSSKAESLLEQIFDITDEEE